MSTKYKIIIAGGREFNDYAKLRKEALSAIYKAFGKIDKSCVTIISGHARGADALGEQFAKEFGIDLKIMPANWDKYGKAAGYRRNEEMAVFAKTKDSEDDDLKSMLIAFWDGQSSGTKHMIEIAKNKKMDVSTIRY